MNYPILTTLGIRWIPAAWHQALTRKTVIPLSPTVRAALDAKAFLWVPTKSRVLVQHNTGTVGATTIGTACTTGAASSTKGTAVQVYATTNFDTYWVTIIAYDYGATGTACEGCLDILIGASTEEVLIANLLMGYCGGVREGGKRWEFPLYIPAGVRLAIQAAGARLSTTMRAAIWLYGGHESPPYRLGGKVTTYGVSTVPNGVAITPGASGAEGAYAEITASTSQDHFAFAPSFQIETDTTTALRSYAVDIATGAATEEEILQSAWFGADANEQMRGPENSFPAFADVPSGTRLVMRASNAGTNDAAYGGAIHAVS